MHSQDHYDVDKLTKAFDTGGKYICAVTFFWLDFLVLSLPHVPVIDSAVDGLMTQYFGGLPQAVPFNASIVVTTAQTASAAEAARKVCKLRVASPPEMILALLKSVSKAVRQNDPETLAKWRLVLSSIPCEFRLIGTEDAKHLLAIQLREDYCQNAESMRLSSLQKLFDIQALMERKKTATGFPSTTEMVDYYKSVTFAQKSEPMTENFINEAIYAIKHVLAHQQCLQVLLDMEAYGSTNPMDKAKKISLIARKCGANVSKTTLVLQLLADFWKVGYYTDEKFAERALDGKQQKCDGKGTVDLVLMKWELLDFLKGKFMDVRGFTETRQHG